MLEERYFLDRQGLRLGRMAGKPGRGHVEIAQAFLGALAAGTEVYDQMFALGFARVMETATTLSVDAPKALSRKQKKFLDEKLKGGKQVSLNNADFIATRG